MMGGTAVIRRILFYMNVDKPSIYEVVEKSLRLCRECGLDIVFLKQDEEHVRVNMPGIAGQYGMIEAPHAGAIDAIFVFGGDGTVLRCLDQYVACDIPVLGVNLGRLGFLLETEVWEMPQALDMLCRGEYEIERRIMLEVEACCGGKSIHAYATNEVSISRGLSQRMIAVSAYVGKTHVDHYIADGVVLASPTGSTAYSLSAGGPIVSPEVPCFVLNPICPHSLQSRPIVLPVSEQVTLEINMKEMRSGIQLSLDGQAVCEMHNHERIAIRRSQHDAKLIRFPKERNFFTLLKDKLSQWSL